MAIRDLIFLKQRSAPAPVPVVLDYTEFTYVAASPGYVAGFNIVGETEATAYIDWGDGGTTPIPVDSNYAHTYGAGGTYTIRVYGSGVLFTDMYSNPGGFTAVTKFNTQPPRLTLTFCFNLTSVPAVLPPNITSCQELFNVCNSFNQDISSWDLSHVTNTTQMFRYANSFNQNISGWDVSAVTAMDSMFEEAAAFNQDLSAWTTGLAAQPSSFSSNGNATFADNANNLKPFLSDGVTRINT